MSEQVLPAEGRPARKPRTRRVHATITRLDPWSVMKVAFVLSAGLGVALVVMLAVLWMILSAADVIGTLDRFIADVTGSDAFGVADLFSLPRVLGVGLFLAALNSVLLTALITLGVFLYNLTVGLVGGIEATIVEEE